MENPVVVYEVPENNISISLRLDRERQTIWITQNQISQILGIDVKTVSHHVLNFKKQRGSAGEQGVSKFEIPTAGGFQFVEHYSMVVVTYVGFRAQITENVLKFQDWAGKILNDAVSMELVKQEIAPAQTLSPAEFLVAQTNMLLAFERKLNDHENMFADLYNKYDDVIEELADRDFYTVNEWISKQRLSATASVRQMWGKTATSLSRERGIERKEKPEGKWMAGRYHVSILKDTCVAKVKTGIRQSLFNYDGD